MSKFSKLVSGLMVLLLGCMVNACSHAKSSTPGTVKLPKVYSELNKFKQDNPKDYLFTLNSRVYDFSKIYFLRAKGNNFNLICDVGDWNETTGTADNSDLTCNGILPGYKVKKQFMVYSEPGDSVNDFKETFKNVGGSGDMSEYKQFGQPKVLETGHSFQVSSKEINPSDIDLAGAKPTSMICVKPNNNEFTCKNQYNQGFIVTDKNFSFF